MATWYASTHVPFIWTHSLSNAPLLPARSRTPFSNRHLAKPKEKDKLTGPANLETKPSQVSGELYLLIIFTRYACASETEKNVCISLGTFFLRLGPNRVCKKQLASWQKRYIINEKVLSRMWYDNNDNNSVFYCVKKSEHLCVVCGRKKSEKSKRKILFYPCNKHVMNKNNP